MGRTYGATHVAVGRQITTIAFHPYTDLITCPRYEGEAVIKIDDKS